MSRFDVLLFFHILGVVILAGGAGIGMATGIVMSRTDSVRIICVLSSLAVRAEHFVTTPGSVITLITGTWFIIDYDFFDIGEAWLWLSYVLWVIAALLGEGVLAPFNKRLHHRAVALEAEGVDRSEDLQRAAAAPVGSMTGMVLMLVTIAFLYLMVFQPGG